jgi:hypothetical protein
MKKVRTLSFIFGFLFTILPVMGQELFVPPLINLFRFSFNQDTKNLPNMRIWGWAKDKIAYTIETENMGGRAIQFYVRDLVTYEFVFSYVTDQPRVDDYYSDAESLEDITRIVDGFNRFEIEYFNNNILPLPIKIDNVQYKCTINIEYNTNIRMEKNFVKSYSIIIEMPDGSSFVKTFSDINYCWVELCGYFINPIDNKIVIVTCEKWDEYNAFYKFIGVN